MAVALTAAEQSVYPPRVQLTVTGLTVTDVVTLERIVSGVRTPVRAAEDVVMADTTLIRVDAELPFGVPITWSVKVNGTEDVDTSGPTTYTLTGGKVAISDAITASSAEVVISSWPSRRYERRTEVFAVGGRTVVVGGQASGGATQVGVIVESGSARENLQSLLEGATSGIIQIRQPGGYGGVDGHYSLLGWDVARWSQDGSDARREFVLDLVETDAWAATLEASGYTYADLAAAYSGLDYSDLAGDYTDYIDLAQAEF